MAVEIITGHTGKEHVTAEAAGALHRSDRNREIRPGRR